MSDVKSNRYVALLAVLALTSALIGLAIPGKADRSAGTKAARSSQSVARLRAALEQCAGVSADVLGVKEPISILDADVLAEGGTTYVRFRDAGGKRFLTTLPSPWNPDVPKGRYLFGLVPSAPAGLFDTSRYRPLLFHGREEKALCGLLIRWAKKNQPSFWLLLSADPRSRLNWYGVIHSPDYLSSHGRKGAIQERAGLFAVGLLARQTESAERFAGRDRTR